MLRPLPALRTLAAGARLVKRADLPMSVEREFLLRQKPINRVIEEQWFL